MSNDNPVKTWSSKRLKAASIGKKAAGYVVTAEYVLIPESGHERSIYEAHPERLSFSAISVGDSSGQAFLVPLDESSRETAEYILRAIAAYSGE